METQKKTIWGKEILLRDDKSLTSAALHLLGILLAITGCVPLLVSASRAGESLNLAAYTVYGISLVGLYTASTVYHSCLSWPMSVWVC